MSDWRPALCLKTWTKLNKKKDVTQNMCQIIKVSGFSDENNQKIIIIIIILI